MYIDAHFDREKDIVLVVGRDKAGHRTFDTIKPDHSFYYLDKNGKYTSIFGESLSKVQCSSLKQFHKEVKIFGDRPLYESDTNVVFRALEQNYLGSEPPKLHTAPIDIEVKFCNERGYAMPSDPHQAITAISIRLDWTSELISLILRPQTIDATQAEEISKRYTNCYIFDNEQDLLQTFLDLIEDVDVLYTWNGDGFDIPYIVNRIIKILGREYTRKLCLWDMLPKSRTFEKFGKEQETYDIYGRVHLDYFQLYRKYTYHEQPSYRLDYISEIELGENKIHYEGTLDELYTKDFEKFIEYNRQDVMLLYKLDNKLKFINLINIISHENCVLFDTALGTVSLTDQAIILKYHSKNQIVPKRKKFGTVDAKIAGGYVAESKRGIQEWIGTVDINSLYPSTIRALNMSTETIIGQVRQTLTQARFASKQLNLNLEDGDEDEVETDGRWDGLFSCLEYLEIINETDTKLIVDFDNADSVEMTAKEIYDFVFKPENHLCISANATIFKTDRQGIIPELLEGWYSQRKEFQKKKKEYDTLLKSCIDPEKKKEYEYWRDYWDHRNISKKIQLNAAYGAITNAGCRFYDQRIGQSTTLSGRTITKHMNAKVSEILLGDYNYNSDVNIGSDTDSCFFTIAPVLEQLKEQGFTLTKDNFVDLCNNIADQINDSFSDFIIKAFNITKENSTIIKCGREISAERGLFIKKKHYAILYYDKENSRKDINGSPGELKIMGLATQRADTPKPIQDFLKHVLQKVLEGQTEKQVVDYIREFRDELKKLKPWEKGTPKRVNNLTIYGQKVKSGNKVTVPGHVRAALNWNRLCQMHNDNVSMPITDGQKTIVCKLKENPSKMTSVGYPIDEQRLPVWFKELPFDEDAMENTLIDLKLERIIGVLNWNLATSKVTSAFADLFGFG